jgi:hypothetical protein
LDRSIGGLAMGKDKCELWAEAVEPAKRGKDKFEPDDEEEGTVADTMVLDGPVSYLKGL